MWEKRRYERAVIARLVLRVPVFSAVAARRGSAASRAPAVPNAVFLPLPSLLEEWNIGHRSKLPGDYFILHSYYSNSFLFICILCYCEGEQPSSLCVGDLSGGMWEGRAREGKGGRGRECAADESRGKGKAVSVGIRDKRRLPDSKAGRSLTTASKTMIQHRRLQPCPLSHILG